MICLQTTIGKSPKRENRKFSSVVFLTFCDKFLWCMKNWKRQQRMFLSERKIFSLDYRRGMSESYVTKEVLQGIIESYEDSCQLTLNEASDEI